MKKLPLVFLSKHCSVLIFQYSVAEKDRKYRNKDLGENWNFKNLYKNTVESRYVGLSRETGNWSKLSESFNKLECIQGDEKSVQLSESPTYPGYDLTRFNCIDFFRSQKSNIELS